MMDITEQLDWAAEEFYRRYPSGLLKQAANEIKRLRQGQASGTQVSTQREGVGGIAIDRQSDDGILSSCRT